MFVVTVILASLKPKTSRNKISQLEKTELEV